MVDRWQRRSPLQEYLALFFRNIETLSGWTKPNNIMPLLTITTDQIVRRLRWIMVAAIIFSVGNTLLGQPANFWYNPETAIRGDGLSIYNTTNHTFDFYLGLGWQVYLMTSLIYLLGAFLFVSILPRKAALIAIFSFIFGHFFGATNWLATRWHLGTNSSSIYALVLVPIIVFSAFPAISSNTDQIIKRLYWVMLVPMLCDMICTLLGQPAGYWLHPEIAHEANQVSRFFLTQGWYAFIFMFFLFFSGIFWLVSIFPGRFALMLVFYFMLVNFVGASCWFFYEWRMGMETPVIFGIILSVIIVMLAFPTSKDFYPIKHPPLEKNL